MTLPLVVIWGASGHAAVVADIIRVAGHYEVRGFLDDFAGARAGELVCGAPILGGREQLPKLFAEGVRHAVIGFGNNAGRLSAAAVAEQHGFELISAVHPRSVVAADVAIGPGSVIAAGAVVNPRARLGSHVIVNTSASIDHDCVLGDGVHVSPGAHIAGGVRIGRGSWIGIGASVIDGIEIGAGTIVGAGSTVVRNLPDHVLAYGSPARPQRTLAP